MNFLRHQHQNGLAKLTILLVAAGLIMAGVFAAGSATASPAFPLTGSSAALALQVNTPTPGLCGTSVPQPWRTAVPVPISRFKAGGASDGQNVYIYGGNGATSNNNVRLSETWGWDAVTEAWTQLADMPTAKMSIQGAHWDGKIYVPGGYTSSNQYTAELAIYDIGTNNWSVGAPMPVARAGAATAAHDGKLYVFGGQNSADFFNTSVTVYDIATNSWSNAAALPRPMSYGRAITFGNDIYHIGGIDGTAGAFGISSDLVYRYDTGSNAWAAVASLGESRANHEVMTDGTRIYAVNGATGIEYHRGLPQANTLEMYDVTSNTWSFGYPTTRTAAGSAGGFAGGKLMIQGGIDGNITYNTVQVSQVTLGPCPTPGTPVTRTPTATRTATRTPSTPTATRTRTPVPTPLPCGDWRHVDAPDGSGSVTFMYDVDAVSSNDAWAVGDQGSGSAYRTMIQHWDGDNWAIAGSPITGTLRGVAAIASDDVWAVGYTGSGGVGPSQTIAMHWNGSSWTVVPSPNVAGHPNYLYAVAAGGPNDVWAVGLANSQSLTMHWDGAQWTIVPVPVPTGYALNGVTVAGPNDAWAVGTRGSDTFIVRWNGTTWTQVASPNPGTYDNNLNAVTAIAPNDVWAVGDSSDAPTGYRALLLHWDGTTWESVPAPGNGANPQTYGVHLHAVAAAATDEVWAVGRDYISSDTASVILRWNGSIWTEVQAPDPGRSVNRLYGAAAVAPGEAWAVGSYWPDGGNGYRALTLRYGPACGSPTITQTAGAATQTSIVTSTATTTATSAVGTSTTAPTGTAAQPSATATACAGLTITGSLTLEDPTQAGRLNTLAQASTCADPRGCPGVVDIVPRHYDAHSFVNTSNTTACFTVNLTAQCLDEILIHSAVYLNSYNPENLCENYLADVGPGVLTNSAYSFNVPAGAQFVVVVNELAPNLLCPSYTLTVTGPACPIPGTPVPTSTSIIPTLTVTAIPTLGACNVYFTDVLPENSFYEQIMCLSCMGMMSGYSDGTFRPNNPVTRGQLSKIVSNTAGFGDGAVINSQTFEDVLVGSTFHMYIERMVSRGIISGYPCGGAGEPCGAESKPYFRPAANSTRGQIAKITSDAARLTDTPSGQAFEDVPPSHTFYRWIERLVMHDMMSGYQCGGAGEPCGAANRPYFRPQANATRGQSSKIVGNAFYPGCEPAVGR